MGIAPLDAGCPQDARYALMAELMAFRPYCLGDDPQGAAMWRKEQSAQPVVDLAGLGHRAAICAPVQRSIWPNIVQFHLRGGEHGSNEFQIARLFIDPK